MIEKALHLIRDELQNYLNTVSGLPQSQTPKVQLTSIVDDKGIVLLSADKYGMTLVNIEEERVMKSQTASISQNGDVIHKNPVIRLNLSILFSALNSDKDFGYIESLKFISRTITFFQGKSVFTHDNSPNLDTGIQKLVVELHTLGLEQQNHLWGSLGAKLIPNVMYKVKMVVVDSNEIKDKAFPIKGMEINGNSR